MPDSKQPPLSGRRAQPARNGEAILEAASERWSDPSPGEAQSARGAARARS